VGEKKMIDPTQTQPLSWRIHQGEVKPWEETPMDPPDRQEPNFPDSAPERLADRGYRLRARIGSGRLGAIYEAQDDLSRSSGSQHFVAILLIDDKIASKPGFAADFERGAAELKSIAHPNIVKLLEYGRDHNRFYLANELLESASLRFVLGDAGALPQEETNAVLHAVGSALQHLHAKSIVHGNLRPENVLVTFGYEVKLLDVVPGGWLVNPADALGVPARQPDKRDDVFGLACLGYEMLTGRHPFNGNTAQEAYRAGLEAEPINGLPSRQWRALANALAVHRDDRTPSVAQFLDEYGVAGIERLRTIVEAANEPIPARPAPAPMPPMPARVVAERTASFEPQRRGIAGKLLLLLVVITLGIAAWLNQDQAREIATKLMASIEENMQSPAAGDRATDAAAGPGAVEEPLEESPAVTDPAPAMVLAPGADAPPPASAREPTPMTAEPAGAASSSAAGPTMESPAVTGPVTDSSPQPALAEPSPAAAAHPAAAGPTRFGFQQSVTTVREGDVAARIVIRRSGDLSGTATVSWWTVDGTALADADYADLGARIERFAPGEVSRTVYVPLTNDAVAEPAKSFGVRLGRRDGAVEGESTWEMRVDVVDDD
jgi:serine/threonine protein kinase